MNENKRHDMNNLISKLKSLAKLYNDEEQDDFTKPELKEEALKSIESLKNIWDNIQD